MSIQEKLRDVIQELRRTPMHLANIIPLLQEAADKLDKNEDQLHWLSCLEDAGVDNWEGIEEAQRMYREEDDD
jgi:cobalamin biosynthesis Co2+ chelatase CbiK